MSPCLRILIFYEKKVGLEAYLGTVFTLKDQLYSYII